MLCVWRINPCPTHTFHIQHSCSPCLHRRHNWADSGSFYTSFNTLFIPFYLYNALISSDCDASENTHSWASHECSVHITPHKAKNDGLNGKSEPSKGLRILVRTMWAEGNDLLAFQNIPVAGFGARAPALIGESLERCFRAQWRCYHIVSGLNGLPTVCLKGSHNDRDQLITASATHCTDSRQTLSWMNKRIYKHMGGKDGSLAARPHGQWASFTHELTNKSEALRFSGSTSSMYALIMKKKPIISTCANTVRLRHPSHLLSLPTFVQNRYFQRHTGAKTERRRGRCSDLSAQHAHPTKVGVTSATFLTTVTQGPRKLVSNTEVFTAHKNTHRNICSATPFMWKVFS